MKQLIKRAVNILYDFNPGLHHQYIFKISKQFIENKVVLDLGCWTGQYTSLAVKLAKKVYGIDPDKSAINFAKKIIPGAEFKVGSALRIPYPDKSFDTVIFSEVLEHIPKGSENKAFSEIYRVLKPNGILILSTPRDHILSIILDPAYFLIGHRHYSGESINKFLVSNNFKIQDFFFSKGIYHLATSNIEALFKIILNKKPIYPNFVTNALKKEQNKKGLSSIYAIAKRNK